MTIVITRLFDSSFDKTWRLMHSYFQFFGLVETIVPYSAALSHITPKCYSVSHGAFFKIRVLRTYILYVKSSIAFYDLTSQSEHHFSSAIIWRTRTALPYIVLQSNLLPTFLLLTFDKSAGSSASMQ